MRILLIEDNPGDARLVQELLKETRGHFTISVAEKFEQGLKLLRSQDVDAVLLDLNLPDSRGMATLTDLQTRFPQVPFVIMTSIDDEELARQAVRSGAQDYLVKGNVTGELLRRTLLYAVERKQAEELLRESQKQNEFLARLIHASSQPLAIGYPDGRLGLVNRAFEELTGYSAAELRSIDWAAVLTPPEWREMEREKLTELHSTGRPIRYEKEYLRKDGTRVPIELFVHLVADPEGKPQYYYAFLTDITERKQADAALRKAHDELELRVQDRTKELLEAREMLERRVNERTAELQAANETLRASRLASLNLVEDAVAARRDNEKANADLQRSVDRFELLAATAGELLQVQDPQGAVESLCRRVMSYLDCHAFFNFLVDEKAGKLHLNACAGIPEEEARRIEWLDFGVAVCGCVARDGTRIVAEHIPTTPDERTELVKSYGIKAYCCHPLLGPGGKVVGTLSFGTCGRETFSEEDISLMKAVTDQVAAAMTRKKSELEILKLSEDMTARNRELEDANKELESFIYSVSHDLRAPVRTMAGFAKIISEDYTGKLDAQGQDYLNRILKGSEKSIQLIDDLLRLARISRQDMDLVKVDLSKKAEAVIAGLREANPGRNVEVEIAAGLTALADPVLAEVVLSNILGNAWKFTSKTENARIEFGAVDRGMQTTPHPTLSPEGRGDSAIRNPKSEMVYFVRDNGAGFDGKYTGKMFRPFQRLHSDQEFEGTGIGLTIVERVIRRHGGKVWAEGEPGKGATVYFTLG